MFSKRTNWSLTPNKLISRLKELERLGHNVVNLTQSNPAKCGFAYLNKDILSELSGENNMNYDPCPRGLINAREAIASYYKGRDAAVDPQRIFLTASTSEAYSFLLRLLANPGDHILVPRPSYPLFDYLAQLNDVIMDTYPLVYKQGWHIDCESLVKNISKETKVIVAVNPNNPTGSFVKKEEKEIANKLCASNNLALISDEVFWDYRFEKNNKNITSLLGNTGCLTFVLGGASKNLGLPQMKVSWTAVSGPEDITAGVLERLDIILDTYLSVNTPSQNALPVWLKYREKIQREITERLAQNRQYVIESVSKLNHCEYLDSEGGWYMVIRLPENHTEEHWALEFLEKDHVFVHPGYFFDFEDEPYIVVSLLPEPGEFREGFGRIVKRIKTTLS